MRILECADAGRGKVRICPEDGSHFLLYKKEAARYGLEEGAQISKETEAEIRDVLRERALQRTLYLLERMDRTEKQIRDQLAREGYPPDVIEAAVSRAASHHYLDDLRYAKNYVRRSQEKKSRAQMRLALLQKGISKEQIDAAFAEELETEPEDVIRRLLEKKHYDPEQCGEKEKQRLYQYLLRRGFHSEEIRHVMRL